MVLLFALTDHLGITAASLSVKEFMLVAVQASGVSTGTAPGNLLRDILWFGLYPCISVHSEGKKTWTVWSQPIRSAQNYSSLKFS